MKKLIIANWKENKTVGEALEWLEVFLKEFADDRDFSRMTLCVSYPLLYPLRQELGRRRISLKLGAQDVSRYEGGAHTGEVSIRQLAGLADCILVGHSERRRYFGETLETAAAKINLCRRYHLRPFIFLPNLGDLQTLKQSVPSWAETALVYEPPAAISEAGVYRAAEAATAARTITSFKTEVGAAPVLYGGSVNEKNIEEFLSAPEIDGVVVGQASLDPTFFAQLIKKP